MSTLLLTDECNLDCVRQSRSRVGVRLAARVRAGRLDQALAAGTCPDAGAELSLRAHRLISMPTRRALARSLLDLLVRAQRPPHPLDPCVRVCRGEILAARAEIEALARELAWPGPVDARGVAQVVTLLRDGASPVYHRGQAHRLADALALALESLDPIAAIL